MIGIDWRIPLDEAWAMVGHDRAVQGNLDPVALFAPIHEIERRVTDILRRAADVQGIFSTLATAFSPIRPWNMSPQRLTSSID